MGMFDYIDHKMPCPCCGCIMEGFQSRDGDCCMNTLNPWEVGNFYSSCDVCYAGVEFIIKPELDKTSVKNLMQAGHDLVNAMEEHLNLRGDEDLIRKKLKDSVFKTTIGHNWQDYYDVTVIPPSERP